MFHVWVWNAGMGYIMWYSGVSTKCKNGKRPSFHFLFVSSTYYIPSTLSRLTKTRERLWTRLDTDTCNLVLYTKLRYKSLLLRSPGELMTNQEKAASLTGLMDETWAAPWADMLRRLLPVLHWLPWWLDRSICHSWTLDNCTRIVTIAWWKRAYTKITWLDH